MKGIKTQFILDELVNKEKLNVNQEELTEHLMRRAQSSGMSPDQFAQAVVEGGQVPMLVGEVARGKALAVVVEAATVKDTNGEVVDLERRGRGCRDRRGRRRGHRGDAARPPSADEDRGAEPGPPRPLSGERRRARRRITHRPRPVRRGPGVGVAGPVTCRGSRTPVTGGYHALTANSSRVPGWRRRPAR